MKRKMISALLCATMVASMAAGCGSSGNDTSDNGGDKSDSGKKVYAIVTKSAGNPGPPEYCPGGSPETPRSDRGGF